MKKIIYPLVFSLILGSCGSIKNLSKNILQLKTEVRKEYRKTGLLIIDMQNYFLKDISQEELKKEIPNYVKIIDFAKENKLPIYLVEYDLEKDSFVEKESDKKTIKEIRDALWPDSYHHLIKLEDSAFENTNLDSTLKSKGLECLILTGVNSSACLLKSAIDAMESYQLITSKDLMSDPEFSNYQKLNDWYKSNTLHFDSTDSLINHLKR